MRRFAMLLAVAALSLTGGYLINVAVADATVCINVETAQIPTLQGVCAQVQAENDFAEFTNEQCLAFFTRLGLEEYRHDFRRTEMEANLAADMGAIATGFPHPRVITCGDGIVEGGETCDDGNRVNGDGCDVMCQTEPEE